MDRYALMDPSVTILREIKNPRKGPRDPLGPARDKALIELQNRLDTLNEELDQIRSTAVPSWWQNWSYRETIKTDDNASTRSIEKDIADLERMIKEIQAL